MKFEVLQIKEDAVLDPRAHDARILGEVDKTFFENSYYEVCEIEADNLDEVFEIGNVGPDEKIKRYNFIPMHSISVGDVIRNMETEELFIVDNIGFKRF